ncbi:hypothetical protein SDC9_157633 [bioreactor metagenome]|uniref:Uncharacterized protein n=1 Tax=bioreactor metagenome TaxID=1076179 RepID=A0A645F7J1_9ZZZZ
MAENHLGGRRFPPQVRPVYREHVGDLQKQPAGRLAACHQHRARQGPRAPQCARAVQPCAHAVCNRPVPRADRPGNSPALFAAGARGAQTVVWPADPPRVCHGHETRYEPVFWHEQCALRRNAQSVATARCRVGKWETALAVWHQPPHGISAIAWHLPCPAGRQKPAPVRLISP